MARAVHIVTYRGRRSPREARKSVAPGRGAQLEMGQHLVGEQGGVAKIIIRSICTNIFIAQIAVLGAVVLNAYWFVFRPCRSITLTIRLPFQVCVNIAIAPVRKTISNAL